MEKTLTSKTAQRVEVLNDVIETCLKKTGQVRLWGIAHGEKQAIILFKNEIKEILTKCKDKNSITHEKIKGLIYEIESVENAE